MKYCAKFFLLAIAGGVCFASSAYDCTLGHLSVWKGHQKQWSSIVRLAEAQNRLTRTLEKYDSKSSSSTSTAKADEGNRAFYEWYKSECQERYHPTEPNGFRLTEDSDGDLILSWNGAKVFNSSVYWTCSLHTTVAELESSKVCGGKSYTPSWNLGKLEYGRRYYAYVQKFVHYDKSTYKSSKAFYSFERTDTTAPVFSSGLSATVDASGTINLTWSHATDNVCLNGYCVQIANDGAFSDIILDGWLDYEKTVDPRAKCSFLKPKADAYYCRVIAMDSSENTSAISANVSIPLDATDQTGPSAPILKGGVSDGFAYARWNVPQDPSGVRGYRVQVSTDAAFANLLDDSYLNVEDYSLDIGSARAISLRICAQDSKGNWGSWSRVLSVANTIPPIKSLTALQYGVGFAGLGWSGVSGATSYDIEISTTKDFAEPLYSGSTKQRTCSFGIPGSGTYHARARAVVGTQKGPWTAISFGIQTKIGTDAFKDVFEEAKYLGWSAAASSAGMVVADGDGRVQVMKRKGDVWVRAGARDVGANSVAASADWWVAGDLDNDGGRVLVQKWSDSGVRQVLVSPNAEKDGEFGASVAIAGEWLFVGATGENEMKGRMHVYRLCDGVWQHRQTLEVSSGGYFGDSVSAFGEWLFVGAPYSAEGQEDCRGMCHIFRLSSGLWRRFQNVGARLGTDCFGSSVAVDGSTAAIGLARDHTVGGENGGVQMLAFDGTSWKPSEYIQPVMWGAGEKRCGSLVALKGDWMAVGVRFLGDESSYDSTLAADGGSVVLFRRVGAGWQEIRRQYAPDASRGQCFGLSLALSDDALVVGAPGDVNGGKATGAIYSFVLPNEDELSYLRPDADKVAVTCSSPNVTVGCQPVLSAGFDACEVQIADNAAFESPWIFVGESGSSSCTVILHPGTYLMRVRGRRNGHWSGWSCNRFVATASDAQRESQGLISEIDLPNLTFEMSGWNAPVYMTRTVGGEACTSFVKGNSDVIRLYCSVMNIGARDAVGKFAVWHRIYDQNGACVYSASLTNTVPMAAGTGFYWGGNDFGMLDKLSYGRYRYVCTLDEGGLVEERDESDNVWEIPFEVTVPVGLKTPSGLTASVDEASSYVVLGWQKVDDADRYVVERKNLADGVWEELVVVDSAAYLDCTAMPGVEYWYRVRALEDGYSSVVSCSLPSAEASGRASVADDREYLVIDISKGTTASRYPVSYLSRVPDGGWTGAHGSSNIVLRKVGGDVVNGDLTPHYVGVFETTQRQWELVMGTRPSWFQNDTCYGLRPVESVSYDEVAADRKEDSFLSRLRQRTGLAFDLPTQDDWEHFCRAGTLSDYNDGSNWSYSEAGGLPRLARYADNSGYSHWSDYSQPWLMDAAIGTSIIGQYRSNNWGLFDMHGNVREMCKGTHVSGGFTNCVVRGGSWTDAADGCKSQEDRVPWTQVVNQGMFHVGFRIVLEAPYTGKGYEVVFDGDGATSGVPAPMFCERNRVHRLPEGGPYKRNAKFVGWQCSNGKRYDDGMLVFNLANPGETVTMTAIWE